MAKSLQDQLLKSGLANRKQAVKARKAIDLREKQTRKGQTVEDETASRIRQAEAEKLQRDRELNRQQQDEREVRAIAAQIRELIVLNRIDERGDIAYRFTENGMIRTVMVQEPHRRQLVSGALAVVRLDDGEAMVPGKVAAKIAERDPGCILLHNSKDASDERTNAESGASAEDDEYADFQVPDDLMW